MVLDRTTTACLLAHLPYRDFGRIFTSEVLDPSSIDLTDGGLKLRWTFFKSESWGFQSGSDGPQRNRLWYEIDWKVGESIEYVREYGEKKWHVPKRHIYASFETNRILLSHYRALLKFWTEVLVKHRQDDAWVLDPVRATETQLRRALHKAQET
jgi:hypothetical protein